MGARFLGVMPELVPEQKGDVLDGLDHRPDRLMKIRIGRSLGHLVVYDLGSVALGNATKDLHPVLIFCQIDSLGEKKIENLSAIRDQVKILPFSDRPDIDFDTLMVGPAPVGGNQKTVAG